MRYWLLLMLLCLPMVFGLSQHTTIYVGEDEILQDTQLVWDKETNVTYSLAGVPETLFIEDGSYQYSADASQLQVMRSESNTTNIRATYSSSEFIEYTGTTGRLFSLSLDSQQPHNMYLLVTLPRGSTLSQARTSVSPQPASINTDGRHLRLAWAAQNSDELSVIVRYEDDRPWILIIISALIVAAGAYLGLRTYRRAKQRKRLLRTLSRDQQEVIKIIEGGVEKQNEIGDVLEWSKSKTSKVLRALEEREVIEKKPHFKTNRITLREYWKE